MMGGVWLIFGDGFDDVGGGGAASGTTGGGDAIDVMWRPRFSPFPDGSSEFGVGSRMISFHSG